MLNHHWLMGEARPHYSILLASRPHVRNKRLKMHGPPSEPTASSDQNRTATRTWNLHSDRKMASRMACDAASKNRQIMWPRLDLAISTLDGNRCPRKIFCRSEIVSTTCRRIDWSYSNNNESYGL